MMDTYIPGDDWRSLGTGSAHGAQGERVKTHPIGFAPPKPKKAKKRKKKAA